MVSVPQAALPPPEPGTNPHLQPHAKSRSCPQEGVEYSFAHLVRVYEVLETDDPQWDKFLFDDSCLHVA
ncbi:hypothetical protein DYQ86_07440 [Acidobacteria bacterium AB60]|nr:hypothetical protein DYQ86_07440 [Acidobacteria bacterium AB60]